MGANWDEIYDGLNSEGPVGQREAERIVHMVADALVLSLDGKWPQEIAFDDAWDTLGLVRAGQDGLARAWAEWVLANLPAFRTSQGMDRKLRRPPFLYAFRALAAIGHSASIVWDALEVAGTVGDAGVALEAVACARKLARGARCRGINLLTKLYRSTQTPALARAEAAWSLLVLRGFRRTTTRTGGSC